MRAHLAEYGVVAPKGREHVRELVDVLDKGKDLLPELARQTLMPLATMIEGLSTQIRKIEVALMAWHRADPTCRRLETIPGIGFITATALAATVSDAKVFRSGRQFSAWLGLVPKQHSSGGKQRMGGISKMGDRYLRHLLVVGATAVVRYTRAQEDHHQHLGKSIAGAKACPPGHCRRRQQDGTDRLGGHGTRRELSPPASRSLKSTGMQRA
jgi:transposase